MTSMIELNHLPLSGLKRIKRTLVSDQRGSLQRLYCQEILNQEIKESIQQINLTKTHQSGTIRGMHFQYAPHAEKKIVSCLKGKIFDVAVDLRYGSSTFLEWHAEVLSPELNNSLVIPEGFAHGFQTLTDDCELLYFHTASYYKKAEGGVSPFDPRISIKWPLACTFISERDANHLLLTMDFEGLKNEL